MRAVVLRQGELVVDDVPEPRAAAGLMLCAVRACGICGSDLHAIRHGDLIPRAFAERPPSEPPRRVEPVVADFADDVILGHEFCAEVLECGPDVEGFVPGDLVVSLPTMIDARGGHGLGWSNVYPGGFAERMVISADLATRVPNGLDPRVAALTEPAAVGEHAVGAAGAGPGDGAIVLGAGPVGLMIVASLAARGVAPIVVSEPAAGRRAMAERVGAHHSVDPGAEEPVAVWHRFAERGQRVLIFEAAGVPGMIDAAIAMAPRRAELVVAGMCCEPDVISPLRAFRSELTMRFVAGYTRGEFAATVHQIAEGILDVAAITTGVVGLDDVPTVCDELLSPHAHGKVLVSAGTGTVDTADVV
ncbi:MAG: zinc-binding dehydrogenase [Acidimicrobiales bacterium]